jgi:hypothetical protein
LIRTRCSKASLGPQSSNLGSSKRQYSQIKTVIVDF